MRVWGLCLLGACGGVETTVQVPADKNEGAVGEAQIQVTPAEVVITDCDPDYARSVEFNVASIADGNVNIDEMAVMTRTDIFYFDEVEDVVIPPGTGYDYIVVATLPDDQAVTGELRIRSNDLDTPDLVVTLKALPPGWIEDSGADSGG